MLIVSYTEIDPPQRNGSFANGDPKPKCKASSDGQGDDDAFSRLAKRLAFGGLYFTAPAEAAQDRAVFWLALEWKTLRSW